MPTVRKAGSGGWRRATLAMIGAYRLAGELSAATGDHRVAFRRYQEGYRETIKRKQQVGPNLRLLAPKNRVGMLVRNTVARLPVLESMAGMERILQPKQTEPLPDYPRERDAARA